MREPTETVKGAIILMQARVFFTGVCRSQRYWMSCIVSVFVCLYSGFAQDYRSTHEMENEKYHSVELVVPARELGQAPMLSVQAVAEKGLAKHVFGWNPYWMGTAYTSFDYSLLSTIAYFSYEVDTATGGYTTVRSWKTTELVPLAHQNGTRVVLTATNFGNANNAAILNNPQRQKTLIDSLVALVKLRNADGVNIDFEGITDKALRGKLTALLQTLAMRFHAEVPGSQVSIALPAVDWSGVFDVAAIGKALDVCIVMGYDYHWAGSEQAGPVAPLDSSALWGKYAVLRSVRTYLAAGMPPEKFLVGVPYYGRQWKTESLSVPAHTTAQGESVPYSKIVGRAQENTARWDAASSTPYYLVQTEMAQGWYDDASSLALKYDAVLRLGLGGVGIWALGYDGARTELWDVLRQKFTVSTGIGEHGDNGSGVRICVEQGVWRVECASALPCTAELALYDVMGRQLAVWQQAVGEGVVVLQPQWSVIPYGVYVVRVQLGTIVWDKVVVVGE